MLHTVPMNKPLAIYYSWNIFDTTTHFMCTKWYLDNWLKYLHSKRKNCFTTENERHCNNFHFIVVCFQQYIVSAFYFNLSDEKRDLVRERPHRPVLLPPDLPPHPPDLPHHLLHLKTNRNSSWEKWGIRDLSEYLSSTHLWSVNYINVFSIWLEFRNCQTYET